MSETAAWPPNSAPTDERNKSSTLRASKGAGGADGLTAAPECVPSDTGPLARPAALGRCAPTLVAVGTPLWGKPSAGPATYPPRRPSMISATARPSALIPTTPRCHGLTRCNGRAAAAAVAAVGGAVRSADSHRWIRAALLFRLGRRAAGPVVLLCGRVAAFGRVPDPPAAGSCGDTGGGDPPELPAAPAPPGRAAAASKPFDGTTYSRSGVTE